MCLAVEARFVRDRADDVAGLHAVIVADFDAEGFEAGLGFAIARVHARDAGALLASSLS